MELVTLPTSSPQRNPVERFWKHLRRKVTQQVFFQTIDWLLEAVTSFFQEFAVCPDSVRSLAGFAA
jgi:transposase